MLNGLYQISFIDARMRTNNIYWYTYVNQSKFI